MRIKQEDLAAFISETLLAVRTGVQSAREQGLQSQLPAKMDFQVEVIQSVQSLNSVEVSAISGTKGTTESKPENVETTVKSGGGTHTVETGTETATKTSTGNKHDSQTTAGTEHHEQLTLTAGGTVEGSTTTNSY